MTLTNRQIERYSRQLIVPDFGGVAQERLLAARVLLLGDYVGSLVLAYLVGAGVGRIDLCADLDSAAGAAILARMRDLNPDSTVRITSRVAYESRDFRAPDLALLLADDDVTLDQARALYDPPPANSPVNSAIVLAHLDRPARIAVIPRRPPCPRCANAGNLLAPIDRRADNAGFVANLAALEAIKLLARFAAPAQSTLIEFRGYEASARIIDSTPGSICACSTARSGESS